ACAVPTGKPQPKNWWARFALPTLRKARLFVARIEIVTRRHGRHAFGARATMRTTASPRREAFAAIAFKTAIVDRAAIDLRLRSGDERRQPVDAAIRNHRLRLRLRLRLELRLRPVVAIVVVLARLMLLTRLVGLSLALMVALLIVARHVRLRLRRDKT